VRRRALAAALLLTVGACGGSGARAPRATVGKPAPTFVAPRLAGAGEVRLTSFRGQVVLVNFFASWCEPCRDELPLLQRTVDGKQAAVIGVLFNDSSSSARRFLRELGITFPTADDDGSIARAYRVATKPGLPVTVAIAPSGVLAARHIGQLRAEDVPALIRTASR
jgi:cytochrome c biogenesis protein CcmG/thiol:disulfide interchange protein DsbE